MSPRMYAVNHDLGDLELFDTHPTAKRRRDELAASGIDAEVIAFDPRQAVRLFAETAPDALEVVLEATPEDTL